MKTTDEGEPTARVLLTNGDLDDLALWQSGAELDDTAERFIRLAVAEVRAARAWRKEAEALIKEAADWTGRPGLAAKLYAFLERSAEGGPQDRVPLTEQPWRNEGRTLLEQAAVFIESTLFAINPRDRPTDLMDRLYSFLEVTAPKTP